MYQQIDKWIESMTLEEKASLCSGMDLWHTKPISRLGINALTITDGPHGVRLAETGIISQMRAMAMSGVDTIDQMTREATCFPTASALAATWNVDLVEHVGEAMGREAKDMGVHLLLSPGMNIIRTPLGGRNFEFFSEDPLLSGSLGLSIIRGIQSQGVGAVMKHLVCNNTEYRRMTVDVRVDERTLHEVYLRAFKRVIEHVEPAAVMSAYNKINGIYCSESKWLLTDLLRGKWGYEGIVISDWAAVYNRIEALKAGLDLEMPGFVMHDDEIVKAVQSGLLDESILNESTRRILKCVMSLSVKLPPSSQLSEHHGLANHAAAESFILLKNDDRILPLSTLKPVKVVLIGRGWKEPIIQGEGSSKVRPIQIDEPILKLKEGLHPESELIFISELSESAESQIREADAVLILAGYKKELLEEKSFIENKDELYRKHQNEDAEGSDRKSMNLSKYHEDLIYKVGGIQKNTVVCLMTGGPVDVKSWTQKVKGLLMVGLSGEAVGSALADVLTGVVNPSGRLPVSWPTELKHSSAYLHFPGENDQLYYSERIYVGYRHALSMDIPSLYPFGFGLSYTEFKINGVQASQEVMMPKESIILKVDVTNIGERAGKLVIQVYSRREVSQLNYPKRQLVGFAKVALQPEETRELEICIDASDLMYYNTITSSFELEAGIINLDVGQSCENITCSKAIKAVNPKMMKPYLSKYTYLRDWLDDEIGRELILEAIRPFVPFEEIPVDHPIMKMFLDMPLVKIVNFSGGLISEDFLDLIELKLVQRRELDKESSIRENK